MLAKAAARAGGGQRPVCCPDKQALGGVRLHAALVCHQPTARAEAPGTCKLSRMTRENIRSTQRCTVETKQVVPVLSIPATLWRVVHTAVSATPLRVSLSAVRRARPAEMVNRMSAAGRPLLLGPGAPTSATSTASAGVPAGARERAPAFANHSVAQHEPGTTGARPSVREPDAHKAGLASQQGCAGSASEPRAGSARRCFGCGNQQTREPDAPAAVARTVASSRAVAKRLPAVTRLAVHRSVSSRQDDTDNQSLFEHPSLYREACHGPTCLQPQAGMHGNSTWQDGPCPHLVPVLSTVSVFFNGAWMRLVSASRS